MIERKVNASCVEDEDVVAKFIRENKIKVVNLVYVYMIRCKNGALYTGVTNNFPVRWKQHEEGRGSKYIKANGYREPVFLQSFESKSEAMGVERKVKKMRKKVKEEMIKSDENMMGSLYYMDVSP